MIQHPEGPIRMWQAQLGVTIDGVWGPVTQAAYEQRLAENAEVERHYAAAPPEPVRDLPQPRTEPLHTPGHLEPVAYVTATGIIRNPGELNALRRAARLAENAEVERYYPVVELHVQDRAEPVGLVTGGKVTFSPAGPRGTAHQHEYVPVNLLLTGEHVADLCRGCYESVSLLPEPERPASPQEKPVVVYQLLTVVWNSLVTLVLDLWCGLVSGLRHLTGGR